MGLRTFQIKEEDPEAAKTFAHLWDRKEWKGMK